MPGDKENEDDVNGHELMTKKKKPVRPSDLSSLPMGEGAAAKGTGAASVAGDQVARRVSSGPGLEAGERPVAKRPVNRSNAVNNGDESTAPVRRKPAAPGQPRPKKIEP